MKKEITEIVNYILVGICTTLVNFLIYWLMIEIIHYDWLSANIIAWIGAVSFAFWANRQYVFKSVNKAGKEAYQFFVLRLITLIVESSLLFIFIQLLGANAMLSKIMVSVVTVISNYGLCKFRIFAVNGGHEYGQN